MSTTGSAEVRQATELMAARDRIEALEAALRELADLMDDVRTGDYTPDSFTTQPARAALAPEQDK